MNSTLDGDRFIDPLNDLREYEEYDARLGQMNGLGRERDASRYTRRTPMQLKQSRPVVRRDGEDIREPTVEEGASFVQRMVEDDPYV